MYEFEKPIVLMSHGDVDGLAAAAMLMREFEKRGVDYLVRVIQPFTINSELAHYDENEYSFVLCDLSITKAFKDIIPVNSVVIDHHPSTKDIENYLKNRGVHVYVDIQKSASLLVKDFVTKDKVNKYLSKLGAAGDWIIFDKELGKQSTVMSAAMSLDKDDWMRYYILGNLVEGRSAWDMPEVSTRSKKAFEILDVVIDDYVTVYSDDNFEIRFYEDGFGFAGVLANKLSKSNKKVAFAMMNLDKESDQLLFTGRVPMGVEFDLHSVFNRFSEWGGHGGGHNEAASGVIKKEYLMNFFSFLMSIEIE